MTFDEFKLAVVPRHKEIKRDLERGKTINEARASVTLTTAARYETKLDEPDYLERAHAEDLVICKLYEYVCREFAKSDYVKHLILRAYLFGSRDGSSAHLMDDSDILRMVGFYDNY